MPLINAKCPNCGGTLQVDSGKDAAICPYCGSAFIVEKAINNYNVSYTVQHADVVNMYGSVNQDFDVRGGILIEYKGNSPVVHVPDNVIQIESNAFSKCKEGITEVFLPDSVRELKDQVFADCVNLTDVHLPKTLQKIGKACFNVERRIGSGADDTLIAAG
ncbi:MAG: leucine-rich repeat protein [Lachnospiraceae bacterium]|nr:leucine-rich repeat protein [Lachnospiraceae bacterium]